MKKTVCLSLDSLTYERLTHYALLVNRSRSTWASILLEDAMKESHPNTCEYCCKKDKERYVKIYQPSPEHRLLIP